MKNTLEGIKGRLDDTEEWISDLKDRVVEITQAEQKNEKKGLKKIRIVWGLWDNIECTNIHIIGVPKAEERKGQRTYLKR